MRPISHVTRLPSFLLSCVVRLKQGEDVAARLVMHYNACSTSPGLTVDL